MRFRRSNSAKYASSFPGGGFNLPPVKQPESVAGVEAKNPLPAKGEVQKEQASSSKPLQVKKTKADRRALQESQRAVKAASKGDPDAKVPGRVGVNYLNSLTDKQKENLELLNLKYDAKPSDYISMIVTDYGWHDPSHNVPVIVRE